MGASAAERVEEHECIVVRLDNTSEERTLQTNVYQGHLEPPDARSRITRVVCHTWDSQKTVRLTHVGGPQDTKRQFEFRDTYETEEPFAGRPPGGTWIAERRVAAAPAFAAPMHPEVLLFTVYYELR